ncbi:ABC transporter ATP-binding protein [Pseudothermotoga elfii]|uniref:ABC transporter ATP-binding protein n=1 Tax=Pseudothermotoga elfii TaxID=38322 RepID=UPI0003F6D5B4|nr:ABC transporter ATP-binding protein [Pseudothermotoga elfii]
MKPIIKIEHLVKYFPIRAGVFKRVVAHVKAVDDVSFDVYEGETLGLVGESGCGKTTIGMTLLRLYEPTSGRIVVENEDTTYLFLPTHRAKKYLKKNYIQRFRRLAEEKGSSKSVIESLSGVDRHYAELYFDHSKESDSKFISLLLSNVDEKRKKFRRDLQIVFQDPYSSLNPRMRVKTIVGEGPVTHKLVHGEKQVIEKVKSALEDVGISGEYIYRFPHEFSGGQRQRIGIARALALSPKLIIADEAVAALDVSIRSQVINLMKDLQKEHKLTYLFISHDLSVIKYICDRVIVMYLGKIVESAPKKTLFDNPLHPYTRALMSAIPIPNPNVKKERIILKGDVPSPINPPSGCRFHTRCFMAVDKCSAVEPELREIEPNHYVACHIVRSDEK